MPKFSKRLKRFRKDATIYVPLETMFAIKRKTPPVAMYPISKTWEIRLVVYWAFGSTEKVAVKALKN